MTLEESKLWTERLSIHRLCIQCIKAQLLLLLSNQESDRHHTFLLMPKSFSLGRVLFSELDLLKFSPKKRFYLTVNAKCEHRMLTNEYYDIF